MVKTPVRKVDDTKYALLPCVRSLIEAATIRAADTEPMPTRSLHDYPPIITRHNDRPQPFQACNFQLYRIRFNIEMRSRLMADPLNDDLHLAGWRYELNKLACYIYV